LVANHCACVEESPITNLQAISKQSSDYNMFLTRQKTFWFLNSRIVAQINAGVYFFD
jgi:hypothetical protein